MALTPPFADADDLANKPISAEVRERAEALLTDASQVILDEDERGILDDLTEPTPTIIRITCAMAIRAAQAGIDAGPPVSQDQWNAGPWGQSRTYANPTGDLYLTKAERRQLGFSRQRAGAVDMWAGAYEETV
jgi:hypothetical protein